MIQKLHGLIYFITADMITDQQISETLSCNHRYTDFMDGLNGFHNKSGLINKGISIIILHNSQGDPVCYIHIDRKRENSCDINLFDSIVMR